MESGKSNRDFVKNSQDDAAIILKSMTFPGKPLVGFMFHFLLKNFKLKDLSRTAGAFDSDSKAEIVELDVKKKIVKDSTSRTTLGCEFNVVRINF